MPIVPEGSFDRVNYLLRPSKQVERKLLMEALHRLGTFGYPIHSYRYLGFGSIYYADLIMFHKYLNIGDMWCVERRPIGRRMRFNKPYDFVKLFMQPFSEVVPTLNRRRPHFMWLDYDEPLDNTMLEDCAGALTAVPPGSVIVITVTAQLSQVEKAANLDEQQARKEKLAAEYNQSFGRLLSEPIVPKMLSRNQLPVLFSQVLRNQFVEAVRTRGDRKLDFFQLFNFRYADGAMMLTFGGLVESPSRIQALKERQLVSGPYITTEDSPVEISVPHLTMREKHWLDQHLKKLERDPNKVVFELDEEAVLNYCKFYKYYPIFHETLV